MVKIKKITKENYDGDVYDMSIKNASSPYFFANSILSHNSLYPHIMIQCNIYGRKMNATDERPVWTGGNKWKVEGQYYSDKLHKVGELFKQWYGDRVVFKKAGDRREFSIKIILNSSYGALDFPAFKHVYDKTAAGDVTRIGRQWIKYSRKIFKEHGYKVLYTDTDSVYIEDPFDDKDAMLKVKDKIINDIKDTVPFPQDTFDMDIDDEIKYMFFFKGTTNQKSNEDDDMDPDDFVNKPLNYMKKNYIYVKKVFDKQGNYIKDDVVIKNLGLRKKSNSELSKEIFWKHLVPKIIETGNCKFKKIYIKELINELLTKDIGLAQMRKEVGPLEQYKKSPTGIQAQVSQRYGQGIHFLIPNLKKIGVGKGKSYCTLEEFKQHDMKLSDIDLSNVWKELDYFIQPVVTKNIFEF